MKNFLLLFGILLVFAQLRAQDNLSVHCYANPSSDMYNHYSINGNQQEYGICSYVPSFYVAILNKFCTPLNTQFNMQGQSGGYYFGNFNHNGMCRQRKEKFFIFRQTDSLELLNLDSLINNWLPDDYSLVIWTPISFDYNQVNTLCPALGNTLINRWGNGIITDSMVVLFGKLGHPQSFTLQTELTDDSYISFNQLICEEGYAGIEEKPTTADREVVRIVDMLGKETKDEPNKLLFFIYGDGTVERVYRNRP